MKQITSMIPMINPIVAIIGVSSDFLPMTPKIIAMIPNKMPKKKSPMIPQIKDMIPFVLLIYFTYYFYVNFFLYFKLY